VSNLIKIRLLKDISATNKAGGVMTLPAQLAGQMVGVEEAEFIKDEPIAKQKDKKKVQTDEQ
jgi:hypothetical protein